MNAAPQTGRWGLTAALLTLAVAGGAAALAGWQRAYELDRTLVQARSEAGALQESLEKAQAEVRVVKALQAEIERLQRETQELHRLRAQYQEWQRLKSDYEQLRTQHAALEQSQQTLTRSLQQVQQTAPRPEPTSWVGIAMDNSHQGGVKVQSVAPGSPASQVDIAAEDLIAAVDGRPVANAAELQAFIASKKVGETVMLSVQRGGQVRNVVLRTAAFPR